MSDLTNSVREVGDGDTGQMAAAEDKEMRTCRKQEIRSRLVAGCVVSTSPLRCHDEVECYTLYSLLCWDRLALLDASSFLKYNRQITPSDWMSG